MKWSYIDPANDPKDAVRLLVGDTDENYPKLYDEEISFFLQQANGSTEVAAYLGVKAILTKLATEPDYKIGPESITNSAAVKTMQDLLKDLDPVKNVGVPYPPQQETSTFYMGMMDNGPSKY